MDKYKAAAEKKLKGQHPDIIAKEALVKANFAKRERDNFFDETFGEIMVDYYSEWLSTAPHETKKREFIYSCALSIGDVKQRLVNYETLGKNIPIMEESIDGAKD